MAQHDHPLTWDNVLTRTDQNKRTTIRSTISCCTTIVQIACRIDFSFKFHDLRKMKALPRQKSLRILETFYKFTEAQYSADGFLVPGLPNSVTRSELALGNKSTRGVV